jgi:hypothetical protein
MDLIATLDDLDRRLHPRQRVGLRFFIWQIVNGARMFFEFWRHCFGCGAFKTCRCEPPDDQMAHSNMTFRTAVDVALIIWKPKWDDRPRVAKPIPLTVVPQNKVMTLARRLHELDQLAETGPWRVYEAGGYDGQDWSIASFGVDGDTDRHVFLTTDDVHVSECRGEGAMADAQFCAEVRNLMPQIIAALRWRSAAERISGSAETEKEEPCLT